MTDETSTAPDDKAGTDESDKGTRGRRRRSAEDGTLTVEVRANLSLQGGQILQVGQGQVTVPDTPEVRACIAQGYLDLVE